MAEYWKGFDKKCPKYLNKDKYITRLRETYELNAGVICSKCYKKDCGYRKQFKNSEKVITVSAFYNTPHFYNEGNFKFKTAIIDEELSGCKKIRLDKKKEETKKTKSNKKDTDEIKLTEEEINEAITKIYEIIESYNLPFYEEDPDIYDEFPELNHKKRFFDIIKKKDLFSLKEADFEIAMYNLKAIEDGQKEAMKIFAKESKWDDLKTVAKLDMPPLKKWLYYHSIYQENRIYGDPHIYKLFDLARQGIKVIFSDASFNGTIFKELLKRYEYEDNKIPREKILQIYDENSITGFKSPKLSKTITINIYTSNIQDKNFRIYKMNRNNNSFRGHLNPKIELYLRRIHRKHSEIGIISYKEDRDRKNQLGKTIQFDKYGEFLHFGNLRGTNSFKNKDTLFIIGTPYPSEKFIKDYNALFIKNVPKNKKIKVDLKSEGSNELNIQEYQRYIVESELYQAAHRIRPFENPDKMIYLFGQETSQLKREFEIVYFDNDLTEEYFQKVFIGIYPIPLFRSLQDYGFKHPNLKANDIAKDYKLYKNQDKKRYNPKLINAINDGRINKKNITLIHKAVLNGLKDLKSIKRKYKNLNMEDSLIEDFIYYAENGNFIRLRDWKKS